MKYLRILFDDPIHMVSRQWLFSVVIAMVILTAWVVSVLTIGFNFPLYVLAILAISIAIFITPAIGLPVIILGTMWFQRWFTLEPVVIGDVLYKVYPLDIVLLVALLGLFFHRAFGSDTRRLFIKKVEKVLIFFMLLCGVYLARAYLAGSDDFSLAVSAFKNYAFYALLFFLVSYTVRSVDDIKTILKVILVGGWGLLLFVIVGIARGGGLWTEYNPLSTEGVRLLSFPHAFYLSVVIVMLLVFYLYRLRPERSTLITMWIQLFGILGSLMRHLWMSIFFVAILMFVAVPKKVRKAWVEFFGKNAALTLLVGAMLFFVMFIFPLSDVSLQLREVTDPLYSRAQSLVRSTADSSARWRIFAWKAAQESFLSNPVFGVGFGQELVIEFETYHVVIPMRDLHNSYLVLLVQMGIIGFAVFCYLLWAIFRPFYTARKAKGMLWPYQLAFLSGLLVFMSAAFWQPYFETNFTGVFFWILAGLLVVSMRIDSKEFTN